MNSAIDIKDEKSLITAAKAVLSKALDLKPGTTRFDLNLRMVGEVTKGEDYEQVIAQSVCPYTLLAVALDKLNGNTADVVAGLVKEVAGMSDKERSAMRSSMKGATQDAMSDMGQSAVKVCSGKTTSKIESVDIRTTQAQSPSASEVATEMGFDQESANG